MASIVHRPGGHKWIQLKVTGKRRTIRLGRASAAFAKEFCRRVETLALARAHGRQLDPATVEWLATIDRDVHKRLAAADLVTEHAHAQTLDSLLAAHAAALDVKESSKSTFSHTARNLRDFFGGERDFRQITASDADAFRAWLSNHGRHRGKEKGTPLSPATVSRRCRRARQIFTFAAEKKRWIYHNPFGGMKGWTETNHDRDHYLTRADTELLLEKAEPEMRLLIAVTRYAGLRCPSEATQLRWEWVNWKDGTIRVRSPKTERHTPTRTVPIFAELREHLEDAWASGQEGQSLVFPGLQLSNNALSKRLAAICQKAGVVPWKKPWNNIRASCETDWIAEHKDIFKVASWMGHSPTIALEHYNRIAKELHTASLGQASAKKTRSTTRSTPTRQ